MSSTPTKVLSEDGKCEETSFSTASQMRTTQSDVSGGRKDSKNSLAGWCCIQRKKFKCNSFKRFVTSPWALALLSLAYFFSEGIVNGVFNVTVTTVEKRFQLRSTESGLIGGLIDLGSGVSLILICYYGDHVGKPKWMGPGTFVCGIGCLVYILPHFLSPMYTFGEVNNHCGNVTPIDCAETHLRNYKYLFMFSGFLIGFGSGFLPVLAISYLDENVQQVKSAAYNGIFYCFGMFGSAFGYILGGVGLEFFTDIGEKVFITSSNSAWVGVWWMGFLIGGICLFVAAVPVRLLPKSLPNSEEHRSNRESIEDQSPDEQESFFKRLKTVLRSGLFWCLCLLFSMDSAFIHGFITYAIKIGVEMYDLSESVAAYYMGGLAVSAAAGGYLLGGIVVTKFKLELNGILRLMIGSTVVSSLFAFGFLILCPEKEFIGATVFLENQTLSAPSIIASCNVDCGCSSDRFEPVCDGLGAVYFSPCHAGCQVQVNETHFADCDCTANGNISALSSQFCNREMCWLFYPVLVICFVSFFSAYFTIPPAIQATLRCVPFNKRTLALSVQRIIAIVVGKLVGRMLFAEALDQACLVSSTECGERGACRAYRRADMARNITILLVVEKVIGVVLAVTSWIIFRKKCSNERRE